MIDKYTDFFFKDSTRGGAHTKSVEFLQNVVGKLQERRGFLSPSDVERIVNGENLTYSSQGKEASNVYYRMGFEANIRKLGETIWFGIVSISDLDKELQNRFNRIKEK